jgi:hypothetical protein
MPRVRCFALLLVFYGVVICGAFLLFLFIYIYIYIIKVFTPSAAWRVYSSLLNLVTGTLVDGILPTILVPFSIGTWGLHLYPHLGTQSRDLWSIVSVLRWAILLDCSIPCCASSCDLLVRHL